MAIATSSPELFTNVIGTFLTKGDIGVGTVVGSSIINVLGVCAFCGIAAKSVSYLQRHTCGYVAFSENDYA